MCLLVDGIWQDKWYDTKFTRVPTPTIAGESRYLFYGIKSSVSQRSVTCLSKIGVLNNDCWEL